ncbi:hypothetical protein MRB53_008903 [Persea americana]|uniref:Uncharacterized protein n=1 Tax=Persea americana TaxID=3435 RepID=A0ACC2LMJ8_PERAE|nr:hypothetical protein MRB53_008903 [Persea americana]
MGRAPCCDKANVKKGPWSPEEDAKLKAYIEQRGTGGNWIALPHKIGLKRCGKSCRLRWLNYLRPNIKHGGFSEEEDNLICNLYISIGSRWSIIAAQLPGRTDNDIKNYWNTRLKKKLLGKRRESQTRRGISASTQEGNEANGMNDNSSLPALSSSALERMQLQMQLQGLHNPFSFYNNPALWPKYHALGEKILQDQYNDFLTMQQGRVSQIQPDHNGTFEDIASPSFASLQENSLNRNHKQEELENSLNGLASSSSSIAIEGRHKSYGRASAFIPNELEQSNMNFHMEAALQPEFSDLLYNKMGGFNGVEEQISELDCLKDMTGTKENMIWWANDFDTKFLSNSWDSSSVFQTQELFLDYPMGYDL